MGPENGRWRFVAVTRQGDSHSSRRQSTVLVVVLVVVVVVAFLGFCAVERPRAGNVTRLSLLYRLNTHREK